MSERSTADSDTRYRAAMLKLAEQTHHEVREIRLMVGVFFFVWAVALIGALVVLGVGAGSDWFSG